MQTKDFLCEIGCEELPPKDLPKLSTFFAQEVKNALTKLNINFDDCISFATPRRFAVLVKNLSTQQPNNKQIIAGPNKKVAFDHNGNPTSALQGFMRKFGVDIADLDLSGEKVQLVQNIIGKNTKDLLLQVINNALASLPIAKRMRWGANRYEFIRPLKWVVMLFGNEVVDGEIFSIKTGNYSYGHRFHHPQAIIIDNPANYEQFLAKSLVIASFAVRRELIAKQIQNLASSLNAKALIPPALLDEVTSLVEYPNSLLCEFDASFLDVPQEALITTMQDNQKYFCLVDGQDKLMPNFITVANIKSNDPQQIIDGNQKVVTARLSDAKFFFEQDKKVGLANFAKRLDKVTFQADLGSVLAKSQRIIKLAEYLADVVGEDKEFAKKAGTLCKADLASSMVGEFPELQGIAGYYYALASGENLAVAKAISEHYKPRFAGDDLPSTKLGAIIALADKIDTLVGIFSIGLIPTGSKDPYALRRAAAGIVRICIELQLDFNFYDCLRFNAKCYDKQDKQILEINPTAPIQIKRFIFDRLAFYLSEQSIDLRYLEAVQGNNCSIFDLYLRIKALQSFAQDLQFNKLITNSIRLQSLFDPNNLPQDPNLGFLDIIEPNRINANLLQKNQEQDLYQMLVAKTPIINNLIQQNNKDYAQAVTHLCEFNDVIEHFFANVMVNVADQKLHSNRFKLVLNVRHLFSKIADFSKL